LDALIAALVELRAFSKDGFGHLHLQDTKARDGGTEVTFWHPSVKRDAADKSCVRDNRRTIESLSKG
jgi:hypothetical protein